MLRRCSPQPLLVALLAAAALYAAAALHYGEAFFNVPVFINLLGDNAFLGIVAVGMTFVILSGGIDLSVGAVMSLSSIVAALLMTRYGWSPWTAFAVALALGTVLGLGMGAVIQYAGLRPFIVTLAGMFFARGLGFIIHLEPIGITHPDHAGLAMWQLELSGTITLPITALLLLAVVVVAGYVLAFSRFGRNVCALGGNEEAALLMGLPVARTRLGVYAVSGFCSALAGVVLTLYLSSGSHLEGIGLELDAIAAVVIGGTLLTGGVGSVFGTLLGVLMIGIILNVMTYQAFSSGMTKLAIGGLLLAFVVLQRVLTRGAARPAAA